MKLFYIEIKLSTGIQLKILSYWLNNKTQLKKHLESESERGLAIVIIVENSAEAFKFCSKDLRFRKILKLVEKYQETRLNWVYMSFIDVDHKDQRECGDKIIKYVICIQAYKTKNY